MSSIRKRWSVNIEMDLLNDLKIRFRKQKEEKPTLSNSKSLNAFLVGILRSYEAKQKQSEF